jgi:hypothetical protein
MINEISSSDVEVVIQDKDMVGAEEILQENQNRNCSEINIQYKGKELLRDVVELLSSSALGAGVGYLAGGMIKVIVDLAKNGITEVQKKSQEEGLQENTSRYIGINDYTVTGISFGATVGVLTYLCVSELIKQRKEREAELRAVRDNIAENDNFNGALSGRQVNRIVLNGGANSEHYGHVIEGEITYENGGSLPDGNRNPQSIMTIGMRFQETNSMQSREGSIAPFPEEDELKYKEFEKKLKEVRESSKILKNEESHIEEIYEVKSFSEEEKKRQIESAKEFLKTNGNYNFSTDKPNLVLVARSQQYRKKIEEATQREDNGAGVFSAQKRESTHPSIDQNRSVSTPINSEQEIPSAYASALQSLKSPRGDVRSSQAKEMHCDIDELMRSQPVFRAVKAFEKKLPQDKSGSR